MKHLGYYLKRIQVFLPIKAHEVVERLAEEQEISQSRVVSYLVVDALNARCALNNQQAISSSSWSSRFEAVPRQRWCGLSEDCYQYRDYWFSSGTDERSPWDATGEGTSGTQQHTRATIELHRWCDLKLLKNQQMLKELGLLWFGLQILQLFGLYNLKNPCISWGLRSGSN